MSFHPPESFRVNESGYEIVTLHSQRYVCVVCCENGWEHVSVRVSSHRCPTWEEMCTIKHLFWDDEDCVMQLHLPKSRETPAHPCVLNLWRPVNQPIPMPGA